MDPQEKSILHSLDQILQSLSFRTRICPVVERVSKKLEQDRTAQMAWEPIPLSIYGKLLPAVIRSSWVFVLRADATTGAERHPNSHQRMMSYRGSGDLQTGGDGRWQSHLLVSDGSVPLENRWISVPPNVWHQAVVSNDDWVVVSFHTASAEELTEERPDAIDASRTHNRHNVAPTQE